MRWVFLATLLVSLAPLVAYAARGVRQRDHLVIVLGALAFASGSLSLDASVMGSAMWPGTARGIIFSFTDCIAAALIFTRRGQRAPLPFLGLFALFFLPMLAATMFASVKMASVYSMFQFAQLVFLYVVLASELERDSAIRSLLTGMAIGLMVQAGFVAQQKMAGFVQASGTTVHQNVLGMMVQLSVLPMIAAIMEGVRSKVIYAGTLAGLFCVAMGGSRAALAFIALGIAIVLILSLSRRNTARKWKIVASGMAAAAVFVPVALGTLRDRFGDAEIGTTDESREQFERAAKAMAADHPFGVGPNNFVTMNNTGGYAIAAGLAWGGGLRDKPVHNAYLLARSETGWLGQITLVLLFTGVAAGGYRIAFRDLKNPMVGVAIGSAAGVTTAALHSNWEFAWYTLDIQRLFFVNAALMAGCMGLSAMAKGQGRRAPAMTTAPPLAGQPAKAQLTQLQGIPNGNR